MTWRACHSMAWAVRLADSRVVFTNAIAWCLYKDQFYMRVDMARATAVSNHQIRSIMVFDSCICRRLALTSTHVACFRTVIHCLACQRPNCRVSELQHAMYCNVMLPMGASLFAFPSRVLRRGGTLSLWTFTLLLSANCFFNQNASCEFSSDQSSI